MRDGAQISKIRGAYPADRAAALAGVPVSTVHYWARREILTPSLSPERVKLWSFTDLMALRVIYWLRHKKPHAPGPDIPATTMSAVRAALAELHALELPPWSEDGRESIGVDLAGHVVLFDRDRWERPDGRLVFPESLDVLLPFSSGQATGPDLRVPRPRLRILPGKLGGAPHIEGTRIETEALGALGRRGLNLTQIARLYPDVDPAAIEQAVDLEHQLTSNMKAVA